jgi:hypothetical protein
VGFIVTGVFGFSKQSDFSLGLIVSAFAVGTLVFGMRTIDNEEINGE